VHLQGRAETVPDKVRSGLIPLLIANWKIWTVPQFVNINFVPAQFRVLFANVVGLAWNAYLSGMSAKAVNSVKAK
jgi:hypothetical protein